MRYLLFLTLILNTLWAKGPQNSIGIATSFSQSPYEGVKNDPLPFPMITYITDTFYIRGLEIGYKIIDFDLLKFNAVINPVFRHLDPSDSPYLSGMDKRYRTIDGGVKLVLAPIPLIKFSAKAVHDTLGVHEGYRTELKVNVLVPLSKSFIILLSHGKQKYSSDYIDYYFGVKASEATSTRSEYIPSSSSITSTGVNFIYNFTDKIGTNLGVSQAKLGDEIKNSPIVDKDKTTNYFVALTYKF
jgi:outer membrane protein